MRMQFRWKFVGDGDVMGGWNWIKSLNEGEGKRLALRTFRFDHTPAINWLLERYLLCEKLKCQFSQRLLAFFKVDCLQILGQAMRPKWHHDPLKLKACIQKVTWVFLSFQCINVGLIPEFHTYSEKFHSQKIIRTLCKLNLVDTDWRAIEMQNWNWCIEQYLLLIQDIYIRIH